MDVEAFLKAVQNDYGYRGQLRRVVELPGRPAVYDEPEPALAEPLARALASLGIKRLYTHQAQAIRKARSGESFVVVTGTASGKSLCYNVPVLETALMNPEATALYLFPTKALAQDQLRAFLTLAGGLSPNLSTPPIQAGVYDGDTPPDERRRLREKGRIILSNPDMLHSGILPRHPSWARFFRQLRYVVIDEIHVYRGIFGSHVANVLRRLLRVARQYGAHPIVIASSATIRNPQELASRLIGLEMALIDDDGAPRGRKFFALWNPPTIAPTGERRSANGEAKELMVRLIQNRVGTIAFVRTRTVAELLFRYVQEDLSRLGAGLAGAVHSYRGGYLPEQRREIERRLFTGELLGVTSTNALELGIDVGSLEACLLVGYPGTIASAWQRAGRAGRGKADGLVIMIGHNEPIDQYLMQHPDYFFGQTPEQAVIDPDNPFILLDHLRCAAYELPMTTADLWAMGGRNASAVLGILQDSGQVARRRDRWFWVGKGFPAAGVSLRNTADDVYTIVDTTAKPPELGAPPPATQPGTGSGAGGTRPPRRVIGTVDELGAFTLVHPEAIYMHEAETYLVEKLDLTEKVAYVHRAEVDYYTQAVTERRVQIVEPEAEKGVNGATVAAGGVDATFVTYMFRKIKFYSRDSLGFGKIDLPPSTLATSGAWIIPTLASLGRIHQHGRDPGEGLVGIANVLTAVVPIYSMCDPADIGTAVDASNTGVPTVFLFDRFPGGLGFTQKAYEHIGDVLQAAFQLISDCGCEDGCPSCVGSPVPAYQSGDPDAEVRGRLPDKEAALMLLSDLLGAKPYVPKGPRYADLPPFGNGDSSARGAAFGYAGPERPGENAAAAARDVAAWDTAADAAPEPPPPVPRVFPETVEKRLRQHASRRARS